MITIEQIRAGRALLDWSQSDLADHAGLSQTGIARIENGTNQPNSKTLKKIMAAFDMGDIEFFGTTGLRKRTGEIRVLRGVEGFRKLMDDVYNVASTVGGEICLFNGSAKVFYKWLGREWYDEIHVPRMMAAKDNFDFKIIISEEHRVFMAKTFAEYRHFPKDLSGGKAIYSYGDRLAFLSLDDDNLKIQVLNNAEDFASSFRVLFNIAWDNAAVQPIDKDSEE